MRPFDVQLMGAIVLHQGKIAEMKTGEGKTLVAPLAAALNAMSGRGVHVVTVNDYLAKRDPQWMGPIFHGLGLSLGIIQHDTAFLFDPELPAQRRAADSTCARCARARGLRRGRHLRHQQRVRLRLPARQHGHRSSRSGCSASATSRIVDEVDNILIDEARTPLIISGQAEESDDLYYTFARLVPRLKGRPEGAEEGGDYFVDLKEHAVSPTEEGIDKIEQLLGVPTSTTSRPTRASRATSSRRSRRTRSTSATATTSSRTARSSSSTSSPGRQMPGRRWSEGLHQAVEAKEGLRVQRESVTLATITFQNYFRLYDKLSGMTGTAMTEQEEFYKIYGLEVVAIPTHRPDGPRGRRRPRLPHRERQVRRRSSTRSRRCRRPAGRCSSAR